MARQEILLLEQYQAIGSNKESLLELFGCIRNPTPF